MKETFKLLKLSYVNDFSSAFKNSQLVISFLSSSLYTSSKSTLNDENNHDSILKNYEKVIYLF